MISVEQIITKLALALLELDDAYPDVGPGMHYDTAIKNAAQQLEVSPADYNIENIRKEIMKVRNNGY